MPIQKDNSISSAKIGMNKDAHISNLKENEYPHAKNSNFWEDGGEGYNIQNEHSNILASKFKEGFKVIGFVNEVNINKTYFFLATKDQSVSEIVVIENTSDVPDLQDNIIDCDDCNQAVEQQPALEDIEQTESQSFNVVVSDAPNSCNGGGCLNFSISHPIKTALIKNEKLGKVLYWTDDYNPPRYLELHNLEQYNYLEDNIDCEEPTPVCLACDKLEIFKDSIVPILEPVEVVLGGNLKRGMYQAVLAYCDEAGNEQSRYFTITEPTPIFDTQNNKLTAEQINDRTIFAIKFKVSNLDNTYSHYKVVIIQNTDLNRATSYFIEGIHTTFDNTVIYTTEQNKERTSIDKLAQFAVRVERLEKFTTANNYLLGRGIT